jgi:DNA-binding MarR family transcriptional regulator
MFNVEQGGSLFKQSGTQIRERGEFLKKMHLILDQHVIFASLLMIANRMETLLSRELKEFGVTTKQWFLSATIESVFDRPPTMKALAGAMGSSHQNIKQVALKLQQKGLLALEKDINDARVTRLKLTEESHGFWKKTEPKGDVFIEKMFQDIDNDDLSITTAVLQKMLSNLAEMDQSSSEETDKG